MLQPQQYESRHERRRRKQVERRRDWFNNRTEHCDQCGGQQSWCSCCQMFTRNCCVPYGTCMCS